MSFTLLRISPSPLAIVFLSVSWAHVQAAALPADQNVRISGDQLMWVSIEAGVDDRERVNELDREFLFVTSHGFDMSAGQTCTAQGPDAMGNSNGGTISMGSTTGGACSRSDLLSINSHIDTDG